MTNELKILTNRINNELLKYLIRDDTFESLFIVGSMINNNYLDQMINDYDVRILFKEVKSEQINKFKQYLEKICKMLTNDNLEVTYSTFDVPIHYLKEKNKKNLLLHVIIYTPESLNNLSYPNKYQYGNNYLLVYGKDYLKDYKDAIYYIDDFVKGDDGLNKHIEMLKKNKILYKKWNILNNKYEFSYVSSTIQDNMTIEYCFYVVNNFINNLMSYCKFNNYDIPNNKMIFCIKLLGQVHIDENTLFLLQGLITKSESILTSIFSNPVKETINLLELFKLYVNHLDSIFSKKEDRKTKILKKNKEYLLKI